jgi:hypothetical protein
MKSRPPQGPSRGTATCSWCGRPATGRLCETCKLGLEKYPDQNPPIVAAYLGDGFRELEAYLGRWAEFDRWLTANQPQPSRARPATR